MKFSRKLVITALGMSVIGIITAACSSVPLSFEPVAPAAPAPAAPAPAAPGLPHSLGAAPPAAPSAPAPAAPSIPQSPRASAPSAQAPAPVGTAAPATARPRTESYLDSSGQVQSSLAPLGTATAAPAAASLMPFGGAVREDDAHRRGGDYGRGYYPYPSPTPLPYDNNFFRDYGVNPFVDTRQDHLSTFAMDVDTASYAIARRFVTDGYLPDPDAVRVEEFLNYFEQGYEAPHEEAFAINVEGAPSPFGDRNHMLMRVGIQGKEISKWERKDATLIFVVDNSGSMAKDNRLGLVKDSLRTLVRELRPTDEIGIVTFNTEGRVILNPTTNRDQRRIMDAINSMRPGGSTNVQEGLDLGYDMAIERVHPDRITRVMLLSDGVANTAETSSEAMLRRVRYAVDEGVTLSTIGVGMGNFNDVLLERLADDGNGNYFYVDTTKEAHRIFSENLTSTLQVIARDAKIQVDFNPEVVREYRLIGYENRDVADQNFRNDSVDAGEIGPNHSVTALYEIQLYDDYIYESEDGLVAKVSVRYQDPDNAEVVELNTEFYANDLSPNFEAASARFRLAATVAEYAEILRKSYWAQDGSLSHVLALAQDVRRDIPFDADVAEFVSLVSKAEHLSYRR